MADENYWGEIPDPDTIQSPEDILREQGELLTRMTKSLLLGTIDRKKCSSSESQVDLRVYSKSLECGVGIVTVTAGATEYPVTIHDHVGGAEHEVGDEPALRAKLRDILSSPAVTDTVHALLSRSKQLDKK